VLASGWNGRFFDLLTKEAPISIEWDGGAVKQGSYVIPKGAKDVYWGQKLLALMTDPKLEAVMPEPPFDPVHGAKIAPLLPTEPNNLKKQFWISDHWWADNGA
jgi:putative spermidine/putrescine transport system substrate-binding protein